MDSSQAVYSDQIDNAGNVFGAAPSFEDRTYYLHDDPTPPVGNTAARLLLTADQVVPTAPSLYNYSTDLDSEPGRHLDEAGYDKNRTDPAEAVTWRLPPATTSQHLVGGITVDYWTSQDGFVNTDQTKIKWFLRDFNPVNGSYAEIEEIEFVQEPLGPSGGWIHVTTVFQDVDYVLAPGHVIELKAEAGHANANLAYDTAAYPSFVVFPEALDIAVTDLNVETPFGRGELVTVRADVENLGADDTSFDLVLTDATAGLVLDTVPVSLAVFATQSVDLVWDSTGASLGKHDFQVEAVVADDIDPTNNIRNVEVDVKVPVHDIALGGVTAPGSIAQGAPLTLTLDVENKGNRTETFDLVLTDATAGVEIERRELTVGIGVKVNTAFVWDSSGASIGDHVLEVEAVVVGDANPGDNVRTKTVDVQAVDYDIRVANVVAPSPVGVGEQVPVDVEVENKGNIATTFDLVLRDTTAGVTVETRSVTVDRGDTVWFAFVWDSSGASIGAHVLEVEAVVVGDANPGDNVRTKTVDVQAVDYDISVTSVAAPSPVSQGDVVSVQIDLENKGNIATTFDLVLRDTTDNVIIETRSVTVARADVESFTVDWDTAAASLGVHVLEAEAVVLGDTNPVDNVKTKSVTVNA